MHCDFNSITDEEDFEIAVQKVMYSKTAGIKGIVTQFVKFKK